MRNEFWSLIFLMSGFIAIGGALISLLQSNFIGVIILFGLVGIEFWAGLGLMFEEHFKIRVNQE